MSKLNDADQIIPGVWVGDMDAAKDPYFFKNNNIKAVVNCTVDISHYFKNHGILYHRVNLEDSLKKKDIDLMIQMIPEAIKFIDNCVKKKKNVLIHCHAGMQRSTCIAVCYLSYFKGMTIDEAVKLILKKRKQAFHHGKHINFEDALRHYAK